MSNSGKKILAFAGSSRKNSFNKKMVKIAAQAAEQAGAEVTVIDLIDYPAPIYNQDLEDEQGMPEAAIAFKRMMDEHDAFLIASPEYNSAFTPLLKNMLDWSSRKESVEEKPLVVFKGKPVIIMATSVGKLGGMRGLVFLRLLLSNLGMIVLPEQLALPFAGKAFNDDDLADVEQKQAVQALGTRLADYVKQMG